jgi:hypothetical protein
MRDHFVDARRARSVASLEFERGIELRARRERYRLECAFRQRMDPEFDPDPPQFAKPLAPRNPSLPTCEPL